MNTWNGDKMLRDERLDKIQEYISKRKYASIVELAEKFDVSKATIRRDLELLSANEDIRLTRGGATCTGKDLQMNELPYNEKRLKSQGEKIRIAQKACTLIEEGETIIVDTGTTTREMVPFLARKKNIHVVTNDVMIAAELAVNRDIEITVIGGRMRKGFYTLRGYYAENFLQQLHVDTTFLSMDSIDVDAGCMIVNMDEVVMKQNMIRCANRTIALCDHKKFEFKSFLRVCTLEDIDCSITGRELPEDIYESFHSKGYQLIRV